MSADRTAAPDHDSWVASQQKRWDAATREPVRFGGWTDYREWADHDFRDRSPTEEPGVATDAAIVVEVLTDLVPIKVLVEEENSDSRRSCLVPSSGMTVLEPEAEPVLEAVDAALIRPYVRSGGRSEVRHNLEFETLVEAARPYATLPLPDMTEDQRQVCRVCVVPQSVAEVAVAIAAPLGLARAIISESIDKGYLRVHDTVSIIDGLPSMGLLRRVYSGLSRLPEIRRRQDGGAP
jgi:hypothetical protein